MYTLIFGTLVTANSAKGTKVVLSQTQLLELILMTRMAQNA